MTPDRDELGWWAETQWWRDAKYRRPDLPPLEHVEKCWNALVEILDRQTWSSMNEVDGHCQLRWFLVGEGLQPIMNIVALGETVLAIKGLDGFGRVRRSLVSVLKSDSALLEMTVAAMFVESGLSVSFPKETNERKTPDIQVSVGDVGISVECKLLGVEKWDIWTRQLMDAVRAEVFAWDRRVDVELHRRVSELNMTGADELNHAVQLRLAAMVGTGVKEVLDNPALWGQKIDLEVCSIRVDPNESDSRSSLGGPEISDVAQARQVAQKGIFEAAEQIPPDTKGIAVVKTDYLPSPNFTSVIYRSAFETRHKQVDRLAAVAIIPQQYMLSARRKGYLLIHPTTSESVARVARILGERFGLLELPSLG